MIQVVSTQVIAPPQLVVANASQAAIGLPITPLQRLRIMEAGEWEAFFLKWVDSLRPTYTDVHRCGGSGDLGRDVIGFKGPVGPTTPWDNYQCKPGEKPGGFDNDASRSMPEAASPASYNPPLSLTRGSSADARGLVGAGALACAAQSTGKRIQSASEKNEDIFFSLP